MDNTLFVPSQMGLRINKCAIALCAMAVFVAASGTTLAQRITAIAPCSAPRPCSVAVTVTGENTSFFDGNSTVTAVWLSKGGSRIDAVSFTGIDANSLSATFDIPADANVGRWDVHVTDSVDGELPAIAAGFAIYSYPDLNGDGKVDFGDFAFFSRHWLEGAMPQDMVLIPAGTFQMGDSFNEGGSGERPVHTVTVDSFYMGKYEITNRQYCHYLNSAMSEGLITVTSGVVYQAGSGTTYPYCDTSTADSGSQIAYSGGVFSVRSKGGRSMVNDPMVMVSWYGAVAYCNWRSLQEGKEQCYNLSTWTCDFSKKGYRLATEAEWEYAARGGLSAKRFPWGDTISHSYANYYSWWWQLGNPYYPYDVNPTEGYHPTWNDGIYPYTSPVGSFPVTGYGLYDMTGNVIEWCNDWYSSTYYTSSPTNNPTGPTGGSYHVFRGGSWYNGLAYGCRVAYRIDRANPTTHFYYLGFRVVLPD